MQIIIGLGANLGDREQNLSRAVGLIAERIGPVRSQSPFYSSEPLVLPGRSSEGVPEYLNAAVAAETDLNAETVLARLLEIERMLGRDRSDEHERWQSRAIDLDLLAYGESTIETAALTVPHPELHKRRFVLEPMNDVAADWRHPVLGKTPRQLLDAL